MPSIRLPLLILILPYVTAEYEKNEEYFHQYYDDVEICYEASCSHYKAAITIRNKYMVDRSDLVICYANKQRRKSLRCSSV